MEDNRDFNDHSDREPQWRPRRNHSNSDRRGNRRFEDNQRGRSGGRNFDRDDRRSGRRFDNDLRQGRRLDSNRRNDRSGRRFDNDFGDERRSGRRFEERSGGRYGNERRFDAPGERRFSKRNDRSGRRFDDRGGRRFDNDSRQGRRSNRFDDRWENRSGGRRGEFKADRKHEYKRSIDRKSSAKEPAIPERVKAKDLDPDTLRALETLGPDNADLVARHLVMAGSLVDIDPEAALEHATAAVARAGRIDVVREACALAAYSCGKYAEALREVRAARRISGLNNLRAIEADCERGLGKPEKAIEIFEQTDLSELELAEQAELIIVASGARADMGESEAGLLLLDNALSHDIQDEEVLARLLSVKVDRLRELGRDEEADEVEKTIPALPTPVSIIDLEEVAQSETAYYHSDLKGSKQPLSVAHDLVLVDLDGVCILDSELIPGADTGLVQAKENGAKLSFITNNASRSPQAVTELLNQIGIPAEVTEIMTSAMDGTALLTEKIPPKSKVLVVGGAGLIEAVTQAGFEVVSKASERPAAVIQGLDKKLVTWELMSQGAIAIQNGALFVATNLDRTLPTPDGMALGNGSLVAALEHATGIKAVAGGKPLPGIYRHAQERSGGENPISVGDRLNTDIAGSRKAGIPSLHVLTGVNDAREVALAQRSERPDFLGIDMSDLNEAHPGPVMNPSGDWTCGDSHGVHIEEGIIYVEGQECPHEQVTVNLADYRAIVAAVWDAIDNEEYVHVPQLQVVREGSPFPLAQAQEDKPAPEFEEDLADSLTDDSAQDLEPDSQEDLGDE